MPSVTNMVNGVFRLVSRVKCNGLIDVSKYVSSRTGMTIAIADVEGPLVNGYLSFATEANDDAGLPHTLEHLVFMGSQDYPYKGVLDLLANRCLASGTNAWTALDNTTYTLTTAGSEGFLAVLPVYLDHVLYPLLTNENYTTEVHHVNGEGEDGGVVYCEMQDYESNSQTMAHWELQKALFPPPSGYGAETGGRISAIRTICNADRVREYHKMFYHPKNLLLIVIGTVDHNAVFNVVGKFEDKIMAKSTDTSCHVKAWDTEVAPFEKTVEKHILCPSDDPSKGIVIAGWRGATCKELEDQLAVKMLMEYLTDSAISPFEKNFVQIDDPLSSDVDYSIETQLEDAVIIEFDGVPTEKLTLIKDKMLETMGQLVLDGFDMKRMKDLIEIRILSCLSKLEEANPPRYLENVIGSDFLYGRTPKSFEFWMNEVDELRKLTSVNNDFWVALLKKYLLDRPYVLVIGEPRVNLVKEFADAEKLRIANQRTKLGDEGLEKKGNDLEAAVEANESTEPPESLFDQFKVPDVSKISYIPVSTSSNLGGSDLSSGENKLALDKLPITTVVNSVKSNFVSVLVLLDTSSVDPQLLPLLALYSSLMFESPIMKDGVVIPYEQVVKDINADVIMQSCGVGLKPSSRFTRMLSFEIKVPLEKFGRGVEWTRLLLHNLMFTKDRLRTVAQRIINSAASVKQEGYSAVCAAINYLNYVPGCNTLNTDIFRQEVYLKDLIKRLDSSPEQVLSEMKSLQASLTTPSTSVLNLICNEASLLLQDNDPIETLKQLVAGESGNSGVMAGINGGKEPRFLKPMDQWGRRVIVPMGSCESAFLLKTIPGITCANHESLPALLVFLQYLTQCEGPVWCEVRGKGLAYGADLTSTVDSGLIAMNLYRTVDPIKAYQTMADITESYLSGECEFDETEFESARSSKMFEVINKESSVSKAAGQNLLALYRDTPLDYNKRMVEKIWNVTVEEAIAAGKKWVKPMFSWEGANMAISCNTAKAPAIVESFKLIGAPLETLPLDSEELTAMQLG